MMKLQDFSTVQSIPGYSTILRVVLKAQMQLLAEQLLEQTGEESLILTASTAEGTLCHLGSDRGQGFLQTRDEIKSQFLSHCIKEHITSDSAKSSYPLYYRNFDSVSKQEAPVLPQPRSQKRKAGCVGSPSLSPVHSLAATKVSPSYADIPLQENSAKRFCLNNTVELDNMTERMGLSDTSQQSVDIFEKSPLCDSSKSAIAVDSKDKAKKTLSSKIEEITERRRKDETQKVDSGQYLSNQITQCHIPSILNQTDRLTSSFVADNERSNDMQTVISVDQKLDTVLSQVVATGGISVTQVTQILNAVSEEQSGCSPMTTNQMSGQTMSTNQISGQTMSTNQISGQTMSTNQISEQTMSTNQISGQTMSTNHIMSHGQMSNTQHAANHPSLAQIPEQTLPVPSNELPENQLPVGDANVFKLKDVSRASHRKPKLPRFNIGVASDDEDNDLNVSKTGVAGDLLDISVNLVDADTSFNQISLDELGDGVLLKENVTDIPIIGYYNGEEGTKVTTESVSGGKTTKEKLKRSYNTASSVIVSGSCSEKKWIKCSMCPEKFPTQSAFTEHLRNVVHTPKKFHCDLCGRMFNQLRDMERHRRIHTGERPFTCDMCGKAFARKDNLKSHKLKHLKHQQKMKMVEQTA